MRFDEASFYGCVGRFTPEQIATFHLKHDVGREYNGERDVCNADKDIVIIGMLAHILKELERLNIVEQDSLEVHRERLEVRDAILATQLESRVQIKRISKFCDTELLGNDCKIKEYEWWYELSLTSIRRCRDEARDQLERLKSVRSIDDIGNLKGVGKKKKAEILGRMQQEVHHGAATD